MRRTKKLRLLTVVCATLSLVMFTACDAEKKAAEMAELLRKINKNMKAQSDELSGHLERYGKWIKKEILTGGNGIIDNIKDSMENINDIRDSVERRFGRHPDESPYEWSGTPAHVGRPKPSKSFGDHTWKQVHDEIPSADIFDALSHGINSGEGFTSEGAREFIRKYLSGKFRDDYDRISAAKLLIAASDLAETRQHANKISENVRVGIVKNQAKEGKNTQHANVDIEAEMLALRGLYLRLTCDKLAFQIDEALKDAQMSSASRYSLDYYNRAVRNLLGWELEHVDKFSKTLGERE